VNQWEPIAVVRSPRKKLDDDFWGDVTATIQLARGVPKESLAGLNTFSHVEVIFLFHRHEPDAAVEWARHPRSNKLWPKVGVFAQHVSRRPNRIGTTIAKIVSVRGRTVKVKGLDAVDGTPVLDLKPVFREFLPRERVRQPKWVSQLMKDYWRRGGRA
jgi:tRNA-Thr(GGU) m(6)t(6)A37 methyltransferase TsaA